MPEPVMYCDGLCEPRNPGGWCCWAWVLLEGARELNQAAGCLGHGEGMTNNLGEYTAVIKGLSFLKENVLDGVRVRTDSQLVVRQLQGVYAVRSPAIWPLYQQASALVQEVHPLLEWVPREQNERADALTREAYRIARNAPQDRVEPDAAVVEILTRLDGMKRDVSDFEAGVLETCLRFVRTGRAITPKQRAVLGRMATDYLSPEAGAQLAGQQELFGC